MKKLEIIILVGVFVIVAGCFSIPIIIFAINSQHDTGALNILEQLHVNINHCHSDQQVLDFYSYIVTLINMQGSAHIDIHI